MMEFKKYGKLVGGCLMLASLTSCLPIAAVSTAMVGTTIAEERSTGDQVDDSIISLKIKEKFTQSNVSELLERVSVTTHEGRVMLTGSVVDAKYSDDAIDLAWKTRGVKEVINEIVVSDKGLKARAQDMSIAASVRSKLLLEKDLRSVNYFVDVNEGVVYLIGVAQDNNELNKALTVARSVKGVKSVVSHVILKDDARRKKQR
jgi:osmotically-inducible protein OsmY